MEEQDKKDFDRAAQVLVNALTNSDRAVEFRAITEDLESNVPAGTWIDLRRYVEADSNEFDGEVKYVVANMRYRLRHPTSREARKAQQEFHRDLREFADLIEAFESKFKRVAHTEHVELHGFTTLWERFEDYNKRFYASTRPKERREEILDTSLQEFKLSNTLAPSDYLLAS